MKVIKSSQTSQADSYKNALDRDVVNIVQCLSKRITFSDNIATQLVSKSDTGSANAEFYIDHNLGVAPLGFIVIKNNKAGVVYDSGTTWTSSRIYLKCSVANCNVSLYLIKE